ncbi:MAG: formylglycine-generating enzyme required for sulfatase activity/serine/threonine protein kinase [Lentimonas sp.]|jgi:formylglycine-generating enzyme required for sulfatase activity/serine/threonine protein kinase
MTGETQYKTGAAIGMAPGETFDVYRVVRCLSLGLLVDYYCMQHMREGDEVTVGLFHRRTVNDAGGMVRVSYLKQQLQSFDVRGVPKITACAVLAQRNCIILEPVRGQSLSQYFKAQAESDQSGVDPEVAMQIVLRLISLLGLAHAKGIHHYDLNSDLIFIDKEGDLQVLGLGLKQALGVDMFESIVSASVSPLESVERPEVLNSFDVMSPEYKSGVAEDHRVDLYAVGVLGYWMFSGQKPRLANLVPLTSLVPDLPAFWAAFCRKLLEREPGKRFTSCKVALLSLHRDQAPKEPLISARKQTYLNRQMNRIADLAGILKFGGLGSRVSRLVLIGLIGLTLTALTAYFVKVNFMPAVAVPQVRAVPAGSAAESNLRLNVQPASVRVQFLDSGQRFTTNNGPLDLFILPGQYRIRVSARDHESHIYYVTISKRGDPVQVLDVALKPSLFPFNLSSEPGARVSLLNESGELFELGLLDAQGQLTQAGEVSAGTYTIIVKKLGFQTQILNGVELSSGMDAPLELPLSPLPSSVLVQTQPSGAKVFLNDVEVGKTPINLKQISPDHSHRVEVKLEGYRSVSYLLEIAVGESPVIDFGQLIPMIGGLAFDLSFENTEPAAIAAIKQDLTVRLDGRPYPYGAHEFSAIPAGTHTVELLHPLYQTIRRTVQVKDGATSALALTLSLWPGTVSLVLAPELDAAVRINGRSVEAVTAGFEVPSQQPIEIEIQVRDHLTMERTFNLQPNETVVWQVEPLAIPGPAAGQVWSVPYLGFGFVWIEPGSFDAGSPPIESGRLPNEGPQTRIVLTQGFWAGVYEVTQAQYQQVVEADPSQFKGPRHPVENVRWEEAHQFCRALNAIEAQANRLPENYEYRLPTEYEWEYFARAGSELPFSFGVQADAGHGNYRGVYPENRDDALQSSDRYGTSPVASYPPNAYGLYDVHGNVSEWTADRAMARLPGGELVDPEPRQQGDSITLRGGSWDQSASQARSAARASSRPEAKTNATGFRLVLAPKF